MLTAPAGTPASANSSAIATAVSGVSAAGLSTTVQPAASAGAIFRAGIAAGMLTQGARFGGFGLFGGGGRRDSNGLPVWLVVLLVSLAVYAISFVLLRLLSRYRELAADRAGAYLTMRPDALASALQKITGGINQIPQRDLRQVSAASALCIAPAVAGVSLSTLTATHPSLEQRLEQLARIQAELSRPAA